MKHLKLFESFEEGDESLSENIDDICKKFNIRNWSVNSDGTVDVDGDVMLYNKELSELPLKFGEVSGSFHCNYNKLTSLEGAPSRVGDNFNCEDNYLTTLEFAPSGVGGNFNCEWNKLTGLEGGPKEVGGGYICNHNALISLSGVPIKVGSGEFWFKISCYDNPIYEVYKLFTDHKSYIDSLDYNYLRGKNIVKSRFQEALDELGIEMPESIPGYKWI